MRKHVAPILAVILLLLPLLLYVGSYFALVEPSGILKFTIPAQPAVSGFVAINSSATEVHFYRSGGDWERRVFWPLEQFDRRLRPEAWHDGFVRIGVDFD
jgi:hypothetical protein